MLLALAWPDTAIDSSAWWSWLAQGAQCNAKLIKENIKQLIKTKNDLYIIQITNHYFTVASDPFSTICSYQWHLKKNLKKILII